MPRGSTARSGVELRRFTREAFKSWVMRFFQPSPPRFRFRTFPRGGRARGPEHFLGGLARGECLAEPFPQVLADEGERRRLAFAEIIHERAMVPGEAEFSAEGVH